MALSENCFPERCPFSIDQILDRKFFQERGAGLS